MRAFKDHGTFCRESLRVRDRLGGLVPFTEWPSQQKLSAAIRKQEDAGLPVRIGTLKTRRSGFTLGSCSHIFKKSGYIPGRRASIIADTYNPAGLEAFGYLRDFLNNHEPLQRNGAGLGLRPLRAVEMEIKDEATGEVVIDVYSADAGEIRGGGRHWLLADEHAFWRAPELTMRSALNMVPDLPDTGIIIQSTANGVGGEFYDFIQRIRDPRNDSGYIFLFFGWLEDPNHWREFTSDREKVDFQRSLDKEELQLQQMHGARLEQLAWRRWKVFTSMNGRVDDFHQEYPTTPEEAFLTSGRPALDHAAIARQPVMEGTIGELQVVEDYGQTRLVFTPRQHGALTIWKRPQPGHWYVIGADPSKGRDVSEDQRGTDPDYSVCCVLDGETGEQVAEFRDRVRPVPFGGVTARLGRWYNMAYLVPESNDPGYIDAILQEKYPLDRIYRQQRDPTDRRTATIDEIGYYTTEISRKWLIAGLDEALLKGAIGLHSAGAIQECRTFVIKPNGKAEHQTGCHDDCVFAAALAQHGRKTAPRAMMTRDPSAMAADAKPHRWGGRVRDEDERERVYRR